MIDRWGNRFLSKVFTDHELEYAHLRKSPVQHIAARFAVKEAVAKAMSTGWSQGFRWRDIEVINDSVGKPSVTLYGEIKDLLRTTTIFVTISHSESVVVAFAVIEAPDQS